ncbi:MAG: universal stress protein [Methanomethylophilus sp.]|jgi:nucleotide-binding universal stress UspA family protein
MYGKILIAVDGSDSNKAAVDQGLQLAKNFGAEVTALTVADTGPVAATNRDSNADYRRSVLEDAQKAQDYIKEKAAEMGVKVDFKIVDGHPSDVIVFMSADYDLVVLATLGKTGFRRLALGSVAETVIRTAKCTVMVCR